MTKRVGLVTKRAGSLCGACGRPVGGSVGLKGGSGTLQRVTLRASKIVTLRTLKGITF